MRVTRSFRAGPLGLALALACLPPLLAQPPQPDPSVTLELATEWEAPKVVREGDADLITSAPFRCSITEASEGYAKSAELPAAAPRLYGQPRGAIVDWLREQTRIEPVVLELPHAVIVCVLKPATARGLDKWERDRVTESAGKVRGQLTSVQRAHLFAWRYLRTEAQVRDLLGLLPGSPRHKPGGPHGHFGLKGRLEFYLISGEEPYQAFGRHFFGAFGKSASWWFQKDQDQLISSLHDTKISDDVLAARFDHMVAYLIGHGYRNRQHLFPEWVPASLGHWFERRHPRCEDTFVINGVPGTAHATAWKWNESDFWGAAKRLIAEEEAVALTELCRKEGVDLNPRERMQAWSLLNFMISKGEGRLRVFLDEMKRRDQFESVLEVQVRSIEKAFGMGVVEFENEWREWVRRTRPGRRAR